MFDFIKPEVSGLKNIIQMYQAYKAEHYLIDDIALEQMEDFAQWYFGHRLGPPLVPVQRSMQMQSVAATTTLMCKAVDGSDNITLMHMLFGLMAAEGMGGRSPDIPALIRTFNKYPRISSEIRGM